MATRHVQVNMKPNHTTYQLRAQTLDSLWHVLLGIGLLFSLLAWTTGARAAEAEQAPAEEFRSELWLDSGFWSHHTKQRKNTTYREQNEGIGLEWRFAPQWQVNAGHYRNSLSQPSNYLQVGWMPLAWRPLGDLKFELGASVGVVNGYSGIANGGYFPTLVPVASTEWKRVGVNLVYIPSVGRIHGAYAAQLKFKLF
jgi:hypothetical protein